MPNPEHGYLLFHPESQRTMTKVKQHQDEFNGGVLDFSTALNIPFAKIYLLVIKSTGFP